MDPAVYSRNRAFRLYLSSKAGKQVRSHLRQLRSGRCMDEEAQRTITACLQILVLFHEGASSLQGMDWFAQPKWTLMLETLV